MERMPRPDGIAMCQSDVHQNVTQSRELDCSEVRSHLIIWMVNIASSKQRARQFR